MSDVELSARIPGILDGVNRLLDPSFDFEAAQSIYEERILGAGIRSERMPRPPLLRF